MDNRVFNVNGRGDSMLLDTLKLAFAQEGTKTTCESWVFNKDKGLILCWHADEGHMKLPSPLTAEACLPMVLAWLTSSDIKQMSYEGWDRDEDHDGSNSMGWRVYCEDWGHVGDEHYAICAVRPAFLWHGK